MEPRTPSSPFLAIQPVRSRLQGQQTPRTPGSMWWSEESPTTPPPSPPMIIVSPPEADVQAIVDQCTKTANTTQGRPEWQFAYVSTLLIRDQAAFEKLAWKLDGIMAHLASSHAHSTSWYQDNLIHLATRTSKHIVHLLKRAWKPETADEYAYSPPSFRQTSITHAWAQYKNLVHSGRSQQACWSQHLSASIGVEMAEKITLHIVSTMWYMVVQDPKRPFSRPTLMGELCRHLHEEFVQWECEEASQDTRALAVAHLAALSTKTGAYPMSAVLRMTMITSLKAKWESIQDQTRTQQDATSYLQVPGTIQKQATTQLPRQCVRAASSLLPDVEGNQFIDAVRWFGELVRLNVLDTPELLARWLRAFFLHSIPWIQIPMYELEAGCALLLLTGSWMENKRRAQLVTTTQRALETCSLMTQRNVDGAMVVDKQDTKFNMRMQCVNELKKIVSAPWVPQASRTWIHVSGEKGRFSDKQSVITWGEKGWPALPYQKQKDLS